MVSYRGKSVSNLPPRRRRTERRRPHHTTSTAEHRRRPAAGCRHRAAACTRRQQRCRSGCGAPAIGGRRGLGCGRHRRRGSSGVDVRSPVQPDPLGEVAHRVRRRPCGTSRGHGGRGIHQSVAVDRARRLGSPTGRGGRDDAVDDVRRRRAPDARPARARRRRRRSGSRRSCRPRARSRRRGSRRRGPRWAPRRRS